MPHINFYAYLFRADGREVVPMGKRDTVWHDFLQDNGRYADIINAFGLEGEQVVTANDIIEADSKARTRLRDEVRKVVFGVSFAVIGIENQDKIDYSMVERIMRYESIRYDEDRKRICAYNKRNSNGLNGGEYMYKFQKTDKLHPVITFVIYCGKEPWDAATSIKGLVNTTEIPEKLLGFMSDYKINVVDVRHNPDVINKLKTDVRDVLEIIRCSEDKDSLNRLLSGQNRLIVLNEVAYNLAKEYANLMDADIEPDEKGKYNMCKAWEDMRTDSINEGKIEGKILARYEDGMAIDDIAIKTGQTVDFVKDTLKNNGLVKA